MTTSTLVHYFPHSMGSLTDEGYQKAIAADLERGYAVKLHDHFFQDSQLSRLCDCPIEARETSETGQTAEQSGTKDSGA